MRWIALRRIVRLIRMWRHCACSCLPRRSSAVRYKPMHKQPVYEGAPVYTNGVEEDLFKVGFCLPAGPYVTDEDVRYIVECIKDAIVR